MDRSIYASVTIPAKDIAAAADRDRALAARMVGLSDKQRRRVWARLRADRCCRVLQAEIAATAADFASWVRDSVPMPFRVEPSTGR